MRIPEIRVSDVTETAHLIDVREDDEWRAGHAPAAVHVPMMQLPQRLAEVPPEGDVVIVCRSGHRSTEVVRFLLAQGFDNVRNLAGGMHSWAQAGRPLISEDGDVAAVI